MCMNLLLMKFGDDEAIIPKFQYLLFKKKSESCKKWYKNYYCFQTADRKLLVAFL